MRAPRTPAEPPVRPGVTLIELVVVLAIIGILLGVAGPAFIVRGEARASDPAAPVVELLQRARRTALESARTTIVIIDPSSNRAWVRTEGRAPNVDTTYTLPLATGTLLRSAVPRPRFVFDASGGAAGDSLFIDSPAGTATVTVDRASGDVRAP